VTGEIQRPQQPHAYRLTRAGRRKEQVLSSVFSDLILGFTNQQADLQRLHFGGILADFDRRTGATGVGERCKQIGNVW